MIESKHRGYISVEEKMGKAVKKENTTKKREVRPTAKRDKKRATAKKNKLTEEELIKAVKREIEFEVSVPMDFEIKMPEPKSQEYNPEYVAAQVKLEELKAQKKQLEFEAKSDYRIKDKRQRASKGRSMDHSKSVTYSNDGAPGVKFQVSREGGDYGPVTAIVVRRKVYDSELGKATWKTTTALSLNHDGLEGADSSGVRRKAAFEIEHKIASSERYTAEELEGIATNIENMVKNEEKRINPAVRQFYQEIDAEYAKQNAAAKKAEALGPEIAALESKMKDMPAMTQKEGDKALSEMRKENPKLVQAIKYQQMKNGLDM